MKEMARQFPSSTQMKYFRQSQQAVAMTQNVTALPSNHIDEPEIYLDDGQSFQGLPQGNITTNTKDYILAMSQNELHSKPYNVEEPLQNWRPPVNLNTQSKDQIGMNSKNRKQRVQTAKCHRRLLSLDQVVDPVAAKARILSGHHLNDTNLIQREGDDNEPAPANFTSDHLGKPATAQTSLRPS